ncbi:hypothetical protein M8C21_019355, partial [Ambrosia artemisiifolia]
NCLKRSGAELLETLLSPLLSAAEDRWVGRFLYQRFEARAPKGKPVRAEVFLHLLRASLFDYELIVGDEGKRLLVFGRFADLADLVEGINGYNRCYEDKRLSLVHQLQLPPSMFTCKTLTKLRLESSGYDYLNVWEFKCPDNLPCLKTLDMFVFSYPSVNAFKLISGCSMLESLTLNVCVRQEDEEDYVFNIPTLKRLKLTSFKIRRGSWTHKVVLHVPNLEYLCVQSLCSLFVMEDVSSLVEASVSFGYMPDIHPWVELLKGLSGVKSLLVRNLITLVDFNSFTSSLPIFPNMKHLVLHDIRHFGQVLQFLESSPELEQLCIEVDPYDPYQQTNLVKVCKYED